MKKIVLIMVMIVFSLCFVFSGCQDTAEENIEASDASQEQAEEDAADNNEAVNQEESEPEADAQEDTTHQQTLEYLSLLGLDETCDYQLNDTFPSGIEGKEMYLISVSNITEENFAAIESALESNGFVIVSDIYTDEDSQTRSYPYSNNQTVYIEIVFSYGAEYFDVTFTPTS